MAIDAKSSDVERVGSSLLGRILASATGVVWFAVFVAFISVDSAIASLGIAFAAAFVVWALARGAPRLKESLVAAGRSHPGFLSATILFAALAFPFLYFDSPYWIHIVTVVFVFAIMAQGLNIHLGELGAINVGYAGFFAVGAYTSSLLQIDGGVSFWLAVVASMASCWFVGVLIGACVIRTTGDYLALVTLSFGLIVEQLSINFKWLTRGTDGVRNIPKPSFLGHDFHDPLPLGFITLPKEANLYFLGLAFLLLSIFIFWRAKNSWLGRVWSATRQDSLGASCFGINVPWLRVKSFALGASFAGLAGSLYASEIGFIHPAEFTIFLSITVISMVILGGMGNWWGVLIASLILVILPEKLREFAEYRFLVYGMVLLLLLIYRPYGLFASEARKHE